MLVNKHPPISVIVCRAEQVIVVAVRMFKEKATPLIWGREEVRVEVKAGVERGQVGEWWGESSLRLGKNWINELCG